MIKITMIRSLLLMINLQYCPHVICLNTVILELYCLHSRTNLFPVFQFDG